MLEHAAATRAHFAGDLVLPRRVKYGKPLESAARPAWGLGRPPWQATVLAATFRPWLERAPGT